MSQDNLELGSDTILRGCIFTKLQNITEIKKYK